METTATKPNVEAPHSLNPDTFTIAPASPRRRLLQEGTAARVWPAFELLDGRDDYSLEQNGYRYTFRVNGPAGFKMRYERRLASSGTDREVACWFQPVRIVAVERVRA